jgi:HTH-type transcriptional regulator/antitoxin MqsA
MTKVVECHLCGGDARAVSDPMEIVIGQRSARVPAERMRCDECGEEFFLPGQMEAAQKLASAQIRECLGLLAPDQVKEAREKYGLSQTTMERLLGVGPKTVVRWERGTVFQNKATDALLRLIRDVPEAAAYLAAERGVELKWEVDPRSAIAKAMMPYYSIAPEPATYYSVEQAVESADVDWSKFVHFSFSSVESNAEPSQVEDPKAVSLESYRNKKNVERIPVLPKSSRL